MTFLITRVLLGLLLAVNTTSLCHAKEPTAASGESLSDFPQSTLNILTPDARQHHFQVWIADTNPRREQGLMFVTSLATHTGMLFIFDQPQRVQMWMKNTVIPLDMLFINAHGRIDSIAVNAMPMSLRIIDSKQPVLAVLELAGGSSTQLGIHAGAIVQHPFFAAPDSH